MLKGKKITFQARPQEYLLLQEGACGECEEELMLNLDKNYCVCLDCQIIYKWSCKTGWKKFGYEVLDTEGITQTTTTKKRKLKKKKTSTNI